MPTAVEAPFALEAARDAAEQTAAGTGDLEAFHRTVEAGVSANLCESLAKIGGRARQGFGVSFGLQRQRDRGSGRIVVRGQFGQRSGRFAVDLDERSYDLAIRAHREGAVVAVEGRLVREGNQLVLTDPQSFHAIGLP